jgi:threonine dehydrogenase-like Zn-dependent dehydrogenase
MLVYRGQFPQSIPIDATIPGMAKAFSYPLKYGYCLVGRVVETGPGVSSDWQGRLVFAFHPHQSHIIASADSLNLLPLEIPPEDAIYLANMETAINLVMDAAPLIGEHVVVLGQGVVGLLTAALLSQVPLGNLLTIDQIVERRRMSLEVGSRHSIDPGDSDTLRSIMDADESHSQGFDLIFELTGSPSALDLAIELAGFDSRIVIGSWYGEKRAPVDLGGKFHRNRIKIISSQVSTIAPALQGRWTKQRRFALAWEMIRKIKPSKLVTHRFFIENAADAYQMLDKTPSEALQVLITY